MSDRDTITLPREVVQEALEALQYAGRRPGGSGLYATEITALRIHLAAEQPKPEPVAWQYKGEPSFDGNRWHENYQVTTNEQVAKFKDKSAQPLYAAPPDAEALRRDAERYRWLRDKAPPDIGDMASVRDSHDSSEIDAAIDAAMKEGT